MILVTSLGCSFFFVLKIPGTKHLWGLQWEKIGNWVQRGPAHGVGR